MTASASPVSQKLASGPSTWRRRANTRRSRKLGRETRQTHCSNIFRWYRSLWGRYTSSDPIGLKGGLNLYRYAADNALRNVDPRGLVCDVNWWEDEIPRFLGTSVWAVDRSPVRDVADGVVGLPSGRRSRAGSDHSAARPDLPDSGRDRDSSESAHRDRRHETRNVLGKSARRALPELQARRCGSASTILRRLLALTRRGSASSDLARLASRPSAMLFRRVDCSRRRRFR